MKILIANDGYHAHYFERMAWVKAFKSVGHNVAFWDCKSVPAFDVFNGFEPEIFIGQTYNLDRATIKCIKSRPHLKVALRAGDWGKQNYGQFTPHVLHLSEQEKRILEDLKKETGQPQFVFIHYPEESVKITHSNYKNIGIKVVSLMMSANIEEYIGGKFEEHYKCDLSFVGGYWPYKSLVIDPYLYPLLNKNLNIKIFGNQRWLIPEYCGTIKEEDVKNLFKSSSICPNLSEPHAQVFGHDVNERCFKVLASGGFIISDSVLGLKNLFEDRGVVFAEDPQHFSSLVEFYLNNTEERVKIAKIGQKEVFDKHTNFHRIAQILNGFDIENDIVNSWNSFKKANGL